MLSSRITELHDEAAWTLRTSLCKVNLYLLPVSVTLQTAMSSSSSIQRAPLILAPSRNHHFYNARALAPMEWACGTVGLLPFESQNHHSEERLGPISFPLSLLCTEVVPAGITCIIHEPTRRSPGCSRQDTENKSILTRGRKSSGEKRKRRLKNDPVLGGTFH